MDAAVLLQYGQEIAKVAQAYAVAKGLTEQLGQRDIGWEDDRDPRAQLHIVDSLGRRAIFWGGRGHGCEPFF
jgi:hypothetical protein